MRRDLEILTSKEVLGESAHATGPLCLSISQGAMVAWMARLRPCHFPFSSQPAPSVRAPGWGVYATVAVSVGAFRK